MKKTILELINYGTRELKESDTPRLDAELILSKVLEKDKLYLLMNKQETVSEIYVNEYYSLINLRKEKMPVKYILGKCEFYGIDLYIEQGVLIPRGDTEILVEEVLKLIDTKKEIHLCDLCSGSGAIGIAIAKNSSNVFVDEIDYYDKPEKITKINIQKNNLSDKVKFIKSDLLNEVIDKTTYDIIVSNPPYIKKQDIDELMSDVKDYEPITALDGGNDGLYFYKKIISQSKKVLKFNGILAFEIGYDQANDIRKILEINGYKNIRVVKDLAGLDRVVIAFLQ